MEITPSPFAQAMGVEQAAPESGAPAEGFSEALAGAGNQIEGPPGGGYPPGAVPPGEGVEIAEPNALSLRPDFHPELNVEPLLASLTDPEGVVETDGSEVDANTDPNIGAIAAAVVGALAMQILPQDANPVLSLKIVEGGKATEGAEPVAAPPVLRLTGESVEKTAPVPMPQSPVPTTPSLSRATPSIDTPSPTVAQSDAKPVFAPTDAPKTPAADATQPQPQPWQATSRRAFDDLEFMAKNLDVIDRTNEPAQSPAPTSPVPEPYVVEGDFFDIQEAGLAPQPVPVDKPVVDDPIVAGAPTRLAPQQPVQTPPSPEAPSVSPSTNEPAPGVPPPPVQTPASEPQQKVDGTKVAPEKVVEVAKSVDVAQSEPRQVERAKPESSTSQPSVKVSDQPRSVQKPDDAPTAEKDSAFREPTTKRDPLSATPKIAPDNTQTIQATTVVDGKSAIPAAEVQPNAVRSQPLQRTETTEVIRQIVDRAEALAAARPRDGVVIHLEPKDLGSITLTVKSVGNQVDAQIGASNEHVRTALEQNRAHLGQAMEFRGLNLTSVTIDNQTTSSNYSQTQQQLTQQQEDRQARQHLASPAHDDRSTAPSLETIRRSVRKADGVDLWT